jgi:putative chitinase
MLLIGRAQLAAILIGETDANLDAFTAPINNAAERFGINTPKRLSAFIAQLAHETGSLRSIEENLNYSAEKLLEVFPRYFKDLATAQKYARKPEAIANRVYANRLGNGDEASGDGWKYRGRGLFQTTGKANYIRVGKALGLDLVTYPALLCKPENAALAAGFYWSDNGLSKPADVEDIKTITKKINGGYNGYTDRLKYWLIARKVFGLPDLKVTLESLAKL